MNLGFQVSGSGPRRQCRRAAQGAGATSSKGHDTANIEGADAVVTSTAVKNGNPEVTAARARHVSHRPACWMLAELMRLKRESPLPAPTATNHHHLAGRQHPRRGRHGPDLRDVLTRSEVWLNDST